MMDKLFFASDYMEGAHPRIMERMLETNLLKTSGYGTDPICESAREKIRTACAAPNAEVYFLAGGTQTNSMVIKHVLRACQGVISAHTGHVAGHEAGAIEHGGHKVLCVDENNGKITAQSIEKVMRDFLDDGNREHMVMPGMVYISQPTESGTIYSLDELEEISATCKKYSLPLFVDGARLAYALACPSNDVTLQDMARLCDVFYIGGTKCGALLGEAVVIPNPGLIPYFFTLMKQHGALLAKGRILGIQFDTLFTDDLYMEIGRSAVCHADSIRQKFTDLGVELCYGSPTNQVFVKVADHVLEKLLKYVNVSFWVKAGEDHSVIRLATSWATTREDVEQLFTILDEIF